MLGIEFAPLKIPLQRRLQTLAVGYFTYQFLVLGFVFTSLIIYLLFTKYYWLSLLYLTWLLYDRGVPYQGYLKYHLSGQLVDSFISFRWPEK